MRRAADSPRPVASWPAAAAVALLLTACGTDGTAPGIDQTPGPGGGAAPVTPPPEGEEQTGTTGSPGEDGPATDGDGAATDGDGMEQHGPGAVLTQDDRGAELRLAVGEEATLQLAPPLQDQPVAVDDPQVLELVPVDHLVDPGYAEYTLLALAPGETVVTAGEGAGAGAGEGDADAGEGADGGDPLLHVVVTD